MPQYVDVSMGKQRDQDSGKYTETVTDDEIVEYLTEQGGAGTTDVGRRFDYKQPSAYRRLQALEEEGRVTSRQIGGSKLWEVAPDE